MNFQDTLEKLLQDFEKSVEEEKQTIRALEESISAKRLEYERKVEEVNRAKEMGFENLDEYYLWNSLDQASEEFLAIESKRNEVLHRAKFQQILSKEFYYGLSYDAIKKSNPKIKGLYQWKTLLKKIKENIISLDEMETIVESVIKQGLEAHYQNLYKEGCENSCHLYCRCGSMIHLPSNRCEYGVKHYLRREELTIDFLCWDYENFQDEPPIIVDYKNLQVRDGNLVTGNSHFEENCMIGAFGSCS